MKFVYSAIILAVAIGAVHASRRYYDKYQDDSSSYGEEEYSCYEHEEYLECGTACEKTCETLYATIKCTKQCVKGCFCKKGYVRIKKGGKCIRKSDCPKPICSKPHQVYSKCGANGCQASCANPNLPKICRPTCTPGCICKAGYILDDKKNCIAQDKCPKNKCKGKHEEYNKCGPHEGCIPTCDRPTGGFVCPLSCNPGCFCKKGYIRNKEGVCILKDDCPKPVCGPGEAWTDCGGIACPPTCEQPTSLCQASCRPGCGCKEGYLRNGATGECIPANKCPKCKGKDEEYMECAPCIQSCNTQDRVCVAACLNPGCYCKPGYLKDDKGTCIPQDKCPKPEPKCTASHEEYLECGPCATHCDKPDIVCAKCNPPGCYCKSGYLRNSKGECIPKEDCTAKNCANNEHWADCSGFCWEKGCHSIKDLVDPIACGQLSCTPGCVCNEGFYRNQQGQCVTVNACPEANQCSINEVFSECGKMCDRQCAQILNLNLLANCNVAGCISGCICAEGYYRNNQGKCILLDTCPEAQRQ